MKKPLHTAPAWLLFLLMICGYGALGQTITTGTITGSPFTAGMTVSVPFTTTGSYTAGNVFTAQLSNALGVFTSPVAIGSITAVGSSTITATIPANTASGTAYRIRVVSGTPAVTGSANLVNLVISTQGPSITSFSPGQGPAGSATVTIAGANFDPTPANNAVFFGATRAAVTAASATALTVTAPPGATFLPLQVGTTTTNNLSAFAGSPFRVTFPGPAAFTNSSLSTPPVTFSNAGYVHGLSFCDIDGDGKADMLVADYNSGTGTSFLKVYRNTATSGAITAASFAAPVAFSVPGYAFSLATADLDGDGKQDVVVGDIGAGVRVFRNTATSGAITAASFASPVSVGGASAWAVAIRDLDKDGRPDLIFGGLSTGQVSVVRNTTISAGSPSFGTAISLGVNSAITWLASDDIDGDGASDLVVYAGSQVSIFRNQADGKALSPGTFPATPVYIPVSGTGNEGGMAVSDLNNDGKPDLVLADMSSTSLRVLRNTATSGTITTTSFAAVQSFAINSVGGPLALADMNGDGNTDVIVSNTNSSFFVFRNTTTGTGGAISLASPVSFSSNGVFNICLAVADVDNDGRPDVANGNFNSGTVAVSRNTAIATITTGTINGSPFTAGNAVSVPFTISATFTTGNVFTAQLSDASGSFAAPVSIGTLSGTGAGTISAIIPASTPSGTAYRIRVVSSLPAATGTDNGTNLVINPPAPEINIQGNGQSIADGNTATSTANNTDFGKLIQGSSIARTFAIQNTGSAALHISTVSLTGAGAAAYAVSGITLPASVPAAGSVNVTITFSPTTTGSQGATVNIASNDADEATYDFAVTACMPAIATASQSISQDIADNSFDGAACGNLVANIQPTGAAPVSGSTTARVFVQGTAPAYNGAPYVRRYYDITPATNADNATAIITLYYTQADFTDYNANNGSEPDLPANENDNAAKANFRLTQQHGSSASGAPGSYTGWGGAGPANVVIDPADENIVWNSAASRWEVTFPVTGFSGFFAYGGLSAIPLPVELVQFSAAAQGLANLITWTSAGEHMLEAYEVERSADGRVFSSIGRVDAFGSAHTYRHTDAQPLNPVSYYRLRMTEADGSYRYSNTVSVARGAGNGSVVITTYPNPANDQLSVRVDGAAADGRIALCDLSGRVLMTGTLNAGVAQFNTQTLASGIYLAVYEGNGVKEVTKVTVAH